MWRLSLYLVWAVAIFASKNTVAIDWVEAEKGVQTEQGLGFAGCYPATSISDLQARKRAILIAQSNISRTRKLFVSGEEHVKTDANGDSHYAMKVSESTSSFLRPVSVANEEIANIENVPHLCVLVVEKQKDTQ